MTKIRDAWISSSASQRVCATLEDAGFEVFFVGGCVRNALLKQPMSDFDISTSATPEQVLSLAKAVGIKAIPTGIEHGTITLVEDGIPFEVTTYRKDVETDGRHAVIAFAETMQEDAARRDFTMNALYANSKGDVFDPIGGLPDLEQGIVRFIGNPEDRIREDYLRILRFFRFSAWYGNADQGIDAEALAACAEHQDGIEALSPERIGNEMRKILAAPDPAPVLGSMGASGILARVLPGAAPVTLAILVHLETEVAPDPMLRLAALGGQDAKERLRLSNAEAKRVDLYQSEALGSKAPAELAYRYGLETARSIMILRFAFFQNPLPPIEDDLARGASASFPIKAQELLGEYEGPALGERLRTLETAWIESGFTLSKDALLAL